MMAPNLFMRVSFTTGRYHGEEWPPAPMRLFQALAAGAGAACGASDRLPDGVMASMQWLERLPPPLIYSSPVEPASTFISFVPNNDDDKAMVAHLAGKRLHEVDKERRKRFTPIQNLRRLVSGSVTYVWDIKEEDILQAETTAELTRHLYCLGRGIDAAWAVGGVGEIAIEDQPCWRPLDAYGGHELLRVPVPGSTDSLVQRQQARNQKVARRDYVDPRIVFREVAYSLEAPDMIRPRALYQLRSLDGRLPFSWRQSDGITLAAMVRHALMENAPHGILGYVSGHPGEGEHDSNRLSWVPLPSTGHQYVDGRIRRVAVLGPRGGDQSRFRRAVFCGQFAILKKDGRECALMVETETVEGAVSAYLSTSREWWTVTPVVLPGHTSKGQRQSGRIDPNKIGALVSKALAREGYPEPEEIFVQNAPYLRGGLAAVEYRVAKYMGYTRLHVRVRFPHPVTGPVLAGVGRHYGLGLFAAVGCM